MVSSMALAPSALPVYAQLWARTQPPVAAPSKAMVPCASAIAAPAMIAGTNQKLPAMLSQYIRRVTFTARYPRDLSTLGD